MMGKLSVVILLCLLVSSNASGFRGLSTIENQLAKLTSDEQAKNEMLLQMSSNANWEQHLIPAPLTVRVFASLLRVSLERDFSLEESAPLGGFQYIRYPQSFRASLVQAAGDGHQAFSVAHGSMDAIRLSTNAMPSMFKDAMEILFNGDKWDIQNLMPVPLQSLKNGVATCQQEAIKVKSKFDSVQHLLKELEAVCTAQKGVEDKKIMVATAQQKIAEEKRLNMEKSLSETESQLKTIRKLEQEAAKEWKNAVEEIPVGSKLLKYYEAEANVKALNAKLSRALYEKERAKREAKEKADNAEKLSYTISGAKCANKDVLCGQHGYSYYWCWTTVRGSWDYCCSPNHACQKYESKSPWCWVNDSRNKWRRCRARSRRSTRSIDGAGEQKQGADDYCKAEQPEATEEGKSELVAQALKMESYADNIKEYYSWNGKKKNYEFKPKNTTEQELVTLKAFLEYSMDVGKCATVDGVKCNHVKRKLIPTAKKGLDIVVELTKIVENINGGDTENQIYPRIEKFTKSSKELSVIAGGISKESPLGTSGQNFKRKPRMATQPERRSLAQRAVENANLKVEQYRAHMERVRKDFEVKQEDYERKMNKLQKIMIELDAVSQGIVEFDEIKQVLNKGIAALAELSEQWESLIQFFSTMKNLIDVTLTDSIHNLVHYTERLADRRLVDKEMADYHRNLLRNNIFRAVSIAHLVEHISTQYVRISSSFLLPRMSGISVIVTFDPKTQQNQINATIQSIVDGCHETSENIKTEMNKHRELFIQKAVNRIASVQSELRDKLPKVTDRFNRTIQEVRLTMTKTVVNGQYEDVDEEMDEECAEDYDNPNGPDDLNEYDNINDYS